jgi:hypothetical protein
MGTIGQKKNEIDWTYVRSLTPPFKPILAVAYPPSKSIIVVDGAHRLANLYERKQETIEAYLLEPDEHLQGMVGELPRNLFKIHHNIAAIFNFCEGSTDRVIPYWKADIEELSSLEDRRWRYIFNVQPLSEMDISVRKIGSSQWVFSFPFDQANPIIEYDEDKGIDMLKKTTNELFPGIKKLYIQCDEKEHPFPLVLKP